MPKQETIILNEFGPGSRAKARTRTTSRGTKARVTIEFDAEPILHSLDNLALGAGPAKAIADQLTRSVKDIKTPAKPSTVQRRNRARANFAASDPSKSEKKRYTGGRTGFKEPGKTGYVFNDSGRLSEGFFVRQNTGQRSFIVNVTANRLTEPHFVDLLAKYVPEIRNPAKLLESKEVRTAIDKGLRVAIMKAKDLQDARRVQLRQQLLQQQLRTINALVGLARSIGGL